MSNSPMNRANPETNQLGQVQNNYGFNLQTSRFGGHPASALINDLIASTNTSPAFAKTNKISFN
jgi:hypothetical protein